MSMLSAQCDELRKLASTLDTRYRYADDIATALREAADTIWDLRNRCADLVGKRDEWQENDAKLRELVKDAHACKENDGCCEDCYADEGDCPIKQRMRELGIEVN